VPCWRHGHETRPRFLAAAGHEAAAAAVDAARLPADATNAWRPAADPRDLAERVAEAMNVHPRDRRRGIPLRPDPDAVMSSDRKSFHRALFAHVRAHTHPEQVPEEIVARAWPADDRAMWLTRAPVSPDSTTGTAAALAITRTASLLLIAPRSAAARLFAKCLQIDLEGVLQVNVPHVSSHPLPLFVAEGGPIPVAMPSVAKTTVGPARKLAFAVGLTRELDEATPETGSVVLGRLLGESAAKALDQYAFDNVAASATRPAGLLNAVVPLTASTSTITMDAAAADISAMAAAMADAMIDPTDLVLVCHPKQGFDLLLARGFEQLGTTVLMSPSIPKGTVIGIAPQAIASAYSGEPEIEVSGNVGAAHFEDTTSASDLMTGSPVRSFWQTDSLAVKVRVRCAWASLQPGAVQTISGVAW
jgi:hypothetical protein